MSEAKDPLDFFLPTSSSRTAAPRVQTARGNYVASVRKPTAVTHSCCGTFTGSGELNLIICKGSLVSIYLMAENGLEHLRDFPMFGRVVFMELSRVRLSKKYTLFIATEVDKLCMFEWDVDASNVISVQTMLFQPALAKYTTGDLTYDYFDYLQGGAIRPNGETVILYSKRNQLRIIHLDNLGHGVSRFRKRFASKKFLDVKFLKDSIEPRLALLYLGNDGNFHSGIYEISADDVVPIRLFQPDHAIEPTLLIPNPNSFLIIGKQGVIYFDNIDSRTNFMGYFDIQAYGRVDENRRRCRYLLGCHDGYLSVIEIEKYNDERLSGFTLRPLGKTSIASSITYLGDDIVFVGSRYADSQLVKMHQLQEPSLNAITPAVQVLKRYSNCGPIVDFTLSNVPIGLRRLVTCCGTHEESSLEAVRTGVGIDEKAFINVPDIRRIWSLKLSITDDYHTFLIFQRLGNQTFAVTIDGIGAIRPHNMDGLVSDSITICCHEARYEHFVQVTERSVRLIDLRTGLLRHQWFSRSKIHCASATVTQVLLSCMNKELVYIEIGCGNLVEVKAVKGYDCACVDIGPVGAGPFSSKLAAVGVWNEKTIRVLSLPELNTLTVEQVDSHIPWCIRLCTFEQVSYLLCALEDETLLTFKLNKDNGQLQEKNTEKLGGLVKTLRTFSSNGVRRVFISTEAAPRLVFTKQRKLQYSRLNLTNIHDMCPFQRPDISEGLAIVHEDKVFICTMGDIEGHAKIPMVNYGRRICHQEESGSYAIIVEETRQPAVFRRHLVQLLDRKLNIISSFRLNEQELGLSIISCSFAGDDNTYYCVGTSIVVPDEVNIAQGRILIFIVRNKELNLISQSPTNGAVNYLKALHGGLLGIVMNIPHYFEWQLHVGAHQLLENSNLDGIEIGGIEERFALLSSMIQKYDLHDVNQYIEPRMKTNLTALLMLQNNAALYSDGLYNIFSSDGFNVGGLPTKVGKWYCGEFATQMKMGTLSRIPDEDYAQLPSVVFSTVSGAIGVIVSLPPDVYSVLNKLQVLMRKLTKGKGCPNESSPQKCVGLSSVSPRKEFIDGDFIESFLTLTLEDQNTIAEMLEVTVCALTMAAAYVTLFH